LVATDYFTKWVEAIPLKKVTSANMIDFVKEHIIYRFGIPQTLTTDQGTMFTSGEFDEFAIGMGIKVLTLLLIMLKLMGRPTRLTKELSSLLNERLKKILGGGTRC